MCDDDDAGSNDRLLVTMHGKITCYHSKILLYYMVISLLSPDAMTAREPLVETIKKQKSPQTHAS